MPANKKFRLHKVRHSRREDARPASGGPLSLAELDRLDDLVSLGGLGPDSPEIAALLPRAWEHHLALVEETLGPDYGPNPPPPPPPQCYIRDPLPGGKICRVYVEWTWYLSHLSVPTYFHTLPACIDRLLEAASKEDFLRGIEECQRDHAWEAEHTEEYLRDLNPDFPPPSADDVLDHRRSALLRLAGHTPRRQRGPVLAQLRQVLEAELAELEQENK